MNSRRKTALLAALTVSSLTSPCFAQRACVEGITLWNGTFDSDAIETLARQRVTCVHLRLRADVWSGPEDSMRRGPRSLTLWEAWDALLDLYHQRGIEVMLELGADGLSVPTQGLRDSVVRTRYASFVAQAVRRYVRRVKVFELVDEPDVPPAGTTAPAIPPETLAALVLETRMRLDTELEGNSCGVYELVLGGLRYRGPTFPFAAYLNAVYQAGLGEDHSGGLWTAYQTRTGRLPFDALAVRVLPGWRGVFSAEGQGEDDVSTASGSLGEVVLRHEGSRSGRRVYLTAGGLASDGTLIQNLRQRDWMMAYFNAAARRDYATPVHWASWYAFADPPWDRGDWGFFNEGIISDSRARPALYGFGSTMARYRPRPYARLRWSEPLLRLRPGQRYRVQLQVTNLGPNDDTATWHAGDALYVGAATGCPYGEDANQVPWTEGGDPLRGRVPLSVDRDWPVDVPRAVEWDVFAPSTPGRYDLSARMLSGTDTWFGQNSTCTVEVIAPSMDAGMAPLDASIPDVSDAPDVRDAPDVSDVVLSPDISNPDVAVVVTPDAARDATMDSAAPADNGPRVTPEDGCGCRAGSSNNPRFGFVAALMAWGAIRRRSRSMRDSVK